MFLRQFPPSLRLIQPGGKNQKNHCQQRIGNHHSHFSSSPCPAPAKRQSSICHTSCPAWNNRKGRKSGIPELPGRPREVGQTAPAATARKPARVWPTSRKEKIISQTPRKCSFHFPGKLGGPAWCLFPLIFISYSPMLKIDTNSDCKKNF